MVKTLKPMSKKEKSADKRKRRENLIKAREQARRFVIPALVFIFALLAAFLIYRFGMGTKLTPEERAKIRTQRQLTKMMREQGTDFSKLREMLADKKGTAFDTPLENNVETEQVQVQNAQNEDEEAVVE
jgi:hypothetical protein